MEFAVIAAVDDRWGIGKNGKMPWHVPEDFKFFKTTTMGATCFMGRHTYAELAVLMQGKKELLPGRKCVVVASTPIEDNRVVTCTDLNTYKDFANEKNFFIGGNQLFSFGLSVADTAYITRVAGFYNCDVFFPFEQLRGFEINTFTQLTPEVQVIEYKKGM